jgi:hypothetical protein
MIETIKLSWNNRYSETDQPDKHGRLARELFYKGKKFCLITLENKLQINVYRVYDYFPSNGNDSPCYVGLCNDSLINLQKKAEQRFLKFLKDIQ